jgi:hypothetical protein
VTTRRDTNWMNRTRRRHVRRATSRPFCGPPPVCRSSASSDPCGSLASRAFCAACLGAKLPDLRSHVFMSPVLRPRPLCLLVYTIIQAIVLVIIMSFLFGGSVRYGGLDGWFSLVLRGYSTSTSPEGRIVAVFCDPG